MPNLRLLNPFSLNSEIDNILRECNERGIQITKPELKPDYTLKTQIELFKQQCGTRRKLEETARVFDDRNIVFGDDGVPGKRKKTHKIRQDFAQVDNILNKDIGAIVQLCLEEDRGSYYTNDVVKLQEGMFNRDKSERWKSDVIEIFDRIYYICKFRNNVVLSNHKFEIWKAFQNWRTFITVDIKKHLEPEWVPYVDYYTKTQEYLCEIYCRDMRGKYSSLHQVSNLIKDIVKHSPDKSGPIVGHLKEIRDMISGRTMGREYDIKEKIGQLMIIATRINSEAVEAL